MSDVKLVVDGYEFEVNSIDDLSSLIYTIEDLVEYPNTWKKFLRERIALELGKKSCYYCDKICEEEICPDCKEYN